MFIDLNIHSQNSSCGVLEPEEIILRAKSVGLDAICFTEDRPFSNWKELKELGKLHELTVLVGLEIPTDQGHFLCYVPDSSMVEPGNLFEDWTESDDPLVFDDVLATAKKAGAILVPAHPFLRKSHLPEDPKFRPSGDRLFQLDGVEAIETRNAHCSPMMNDFALEATFHLKQTGISGSDTHKNLNSLGTVATMFLNPVTDEKELVEAITRSETWPVELMEEVRLRPRPQSRSGGGGSRGGDRGGSRGGRGGDRGGRSGGRSGGYNRR